jgi:transmembrane sensor
MKPAKSHEQVKSEAMDWVLRRDAHALSPREADEFEQWLADADANRELFASTESFWTAMDQLGAHPRMAEKREWALRAKRHHTTRRAIAASLAAVVLGAGSFGLWSWNAGPKPLATQSFSTALGQRATVTLPDGSAVTLNTDTRVRTVADGDRRLVFLDRGQAFFKVAKDRRHPFIVTAAGRTVTALGTAFEVRVDGGGFKVVLVEGRVRVASAPTVKSPTPPASGGQAKDAPPPAIATDMSAGSQLVASGDTDWRVTRANVPQETSWLTGQLIFDSQALGDVVAEMNRYSPRKMEIADARLAARRISGVYTPGDVQAFSLALRDAKVADLKEGPGGQIQIVALK